MIILFKHNHIGQLQEVIVAPDVEFALVDDVRDNIGLYYINVCFRNTFLQEFQEEFLCQVDIIKLLCTHSQMIKIQCHAISYIPLEIVPVAPLYAILPGTKS